jgi:hypothetical protein
MTKYTIGWSICGETEIDAASREEAEEMFNCLSNTELAAEGELEVLDGPECDEDRKIAAEKQRLAWDRWREEHEKREAARMLVVGELTLEEPE